MNLKFSTELPLKNGNQPKIGNEKVDMKEKIKKMPLFDSF